MAEINKENLTGLAQQAIAEGGYDCEVFAVFQIPEGLDWCIQFTNNYGQFCENYYDSNTGHNPPLEVIKDRIARYLSDASQSLGES